MIFQENVSFDHYFGTYPTGLNPSGEPRFVAKKGTPSVNGLGTLVDGEPDGVLLTDNPTANNLGERLQCDQSVPAWPFPGIDLRPRNQTDMAVTYGCHFRLGTFSRNFCGGGV